MKTKKWTLVSVTQVVAVFILNTQALAGPVLHTTTYSDGLTTGVWNGPGSATTTQAATLKSSMCLCLSGGYCYQAVIDKAYAFSYADTITLPEVGQTFNEGFIDQTFHDTTKTHEDWHKAYIDALLNSTYGALETWSASYLSGCFHTEASALAAGNSDLANALTTAQNAFTADFSTDVTNPAFGHQNAVAVIQNIDGVDTWRSQNPDWGQAAVDFANSITVSFTTSPGDCVCIPDPASLTLAIIGLGTVGILRRRKALG